MTRRWRWYAILLALAVVYMVALDDPAIAGKVSYAVQDFGGYVTPNQIGTLFLKFSLFNKHVPGWVGIGGTLFLLLAAPFIFGFALKRIEDRKGVAISIAAYIAATVVLDGLFLI
jgi:hypothetical protein